MAENEDTIDENNLATMGMLNEMIPGTDLNEAQLMEYMQQLNNPTNASDNDKPEYIFATNNHFITKSGSNEIETTQDSKENTNNDNDHTNDTKTDDHESDEYFLLQGLKLMKEGNLNEAILAFEACVATKSTRSDGWRYLGMCHVSNENENCGIAAYLQCIAHDSSDLDALLYLGQSYTNEIDPKLALKYLKSWIANHSKYSNLIEHNDNMNDEKSIDSREIAMNTSFNSRREHKKIVDLFNKALEINSSDADVHIALGMLYNITSDYDKAVIHFKAALETRPNDATLWNKLGATQANGSRCGEAVKAYKKALALKPNYVRTLSNLGIAYANQDMHKEACEAYLSTLEKNGKAETVWDHLRMSLMHLGKMELVTLCDKRDPSLFKTHFKF